MTAKAKDSVGGHDAPGGATATEHGSASGESSNLHRKDAVSITINGKPYEIHRGRQSVATIKTLGGVPQADELAQVIEGNTPPLTPLPDDGTVTIKGDELFVSYPKDSGSSHWMA